MDARGDLVADQLDFRARVGRPCQRDASLYRLVLRRGQRLRIELRRGAGDIQDSLRRPAIGADFQLPARENPLCRADILRRSASKTIDRLVEIADETDLWVWMLALRFRPCEHLQQFELQDVAVLEFIHEDVPKPAAVTQPARGRGVRRSKRIERISDEVAEVGQLES